MLAVVLYLFLQLSFRHSFCKAVWQVLANVRKLHSSGCYMVLSVKSLLINVYIYTYIYIYMIGWAKNLLKNAQYGCRAIYPSILGVTCQHILATETMEYHIKWKLVLQEGQGAGMWNLPLCRICEQILSIEVCQWQLNINLDVTCSKLLILFRLSGMGLRTWLWLKEPFVLILMVIEIKIQIIQVT